MMLLTIEDEKFAEGRAEGIAEGIRIGDKRARNEEKSSIYERLISSGKFSPQEAAAITGWNVNSSYSMN